MFDRVDLPVDDLFKPRNRLCNCQFLRCRIARHARFFILGTHPEPPSRFGLEIKLALNIEHERQIFRHVCRQAKLGHRTTIGRNSRLPRSGHRSQPVCPGPGSVYHATGVIFFPADIGDTPAPRYPLETGDPRPALQVHAGIERLSKVMGVKRCYIDIGAGRFPNRSRPCRANPRNAALHLGGPQPLQHRPRCLEPLEKITDKCRILIARNVQGPPLLQKAAAAQIFPGCQRKGNDVRAAVTLLPECSRTPRGMISRPVLRFQQQDPCTA